MTNNDTVNVAPPAPSETEKRDGCWVQRMFRRHWRRWLDRLKAKLRDWLFADYKWVTRAQVQREICALRWEYRDHKLVQRVLNDLKETIK